MEDLKDKKYADSWFQEESEKLEIQPPLNHFNRVQSSLGRKRWTRQLTRWVSATAATLAIGVVAYFAYPQLSYSTSPIVELQADEVESYYKEYGHFLQSADYHQLQDAYEMRQSE